MNVARSRTSVYQRIESGLLQVAPLELASVLIDEYQELKRRYATSDFRPSELSGARFSEAAIRICLHVCTGSYPPLGKPLNKADDILKTLENTATSFGDTWRLHIPTTFRLICDLRNKRDVAHLGGEVSPNYTDSTLVVINASWILSEMVRVTSRLPIHEAEQLVNGLVERKIPLIYDADDVFRILVPMTTDDRALVTLLHYWPDDMGDSDLAKKIEYVNVSRFRSTKLSSLHRKALVHYAGNQVRLLPPGRVHAEDVVQRIASLG